MHFVVVDIDILNVVGVAIRGDLKSLGSVPRVVVEGFVEGPG